MLRSEWEIFVGRTWWWLPVHYNLKGQVPHICIAGATGSGKSEFLKLLLFMICQKQDEEKLEIQIIDLKEGATFAAWLHAPQITKVVHSTENALKLLTSARDEMVKRLGKIRDARYNFLKDPYFKEFFLVLDEGGNLSPEDADGDEKKMRSECMHILSELARIGREAGMHIVYTTQRPDNNTLPTTIRSQLETRFCFRVKENIDSNIVIRHSGAELLPLIPGRMIMQTPFKEVEVQAAYVPKDVIQAWLQSYATAPPYGTDNSLSTPVPVSDWE